MTRQIFVDTGAWTAIANSGDIHHAAALTFRDEIVGRCRLVSTNYVLDELFTLMAAGYRETVNFKLKLDVMIHKKTLELVWVSEDVAAQAWKVFELFNTDKQWSFTDALLSLS